MVGVDNDRVESCVIKEVTKVIERSKRGRQDKDTEYVSHAMTELDKPQR